MTESKRERIIVVFNDFQGRNMVIAGTVTQVALHIHARLMAPPIPELKDFLEASTADLRAIAKRKPVKLYDEKSQTETMRRFRSHKDRCKSFIQKALRAKLIRKIPFPKRKS